MSAILSEGLFEAYLELTPPAGNKQDGQDDVPFWGAKAVDRQYEGMAEPPPDGL